MPWQIVTGQLRVAVLDVEEAPLDMSLSPIRVPENAPVDTQVGKPLPGLCPPWRESSTREPGIKNYEASNCTDISD